MSTDALNLLGLASNIIGVVVVFFYAFPQPTFEGHVGLELEDATVLEDGRTVAQHKLGAVALRSKYRNRARVGLALLGLGFSLQLVALPV